MIYLSILSSLGSSFFFSMKFASICALHTVPCGFGFSTATAGSCPNLPEYDRAVALKDGVNELEAAGTSLFSGVYPPGGFWIAFHM